MQTCACSTESFMTLPAVISIYIPAFFTVLFSICLNVITAFTIYFFFGFVLLNVLSTVFLFLIHFKRPFRPGQRSTATFWSNLAFLPGLHDFEKYLNVVFFSFIYFGEVFY